MSQSKTSGDSQSASNELKPIMISEDMESEFTSSELRYVLLVNMIIAAEKDIRNAPGEDSVRTRHPEKILTWLEELPPCGARSDGVEGMQALSLEEEQSYPHWEDLHDAFMRLEKLRLIKTFGHFISSQRRRSKGQKTKTKTAAELDQKIVQAYTSVQADYSRRKNDLYRSGVMGSLVDLLLEREDPNQDQGRVGDALENLLGEAWLETFAASVVDSWQEALDGVFCVKLD